MSKQALISVSDKRGVVDFARALHRLGYRLLSTGGTARLLAEAGFAVTEVAEYTGFPEMLDGRVKTLNPRIHAGLLARRPDAAHMQALAAALRSTRSTSWRSTCIRSSRRSRARTARFDDAIENIDIGGPAMLRAAAKNHESVAAIVDPGRLRGVVAELRAVGQRRRRDAARARQEGLRTHRALRRHDRQLPDRAGRRGAGQTEFPDVLTPPVDQGAADALRREPASARGVLPRTQRRRRAARRILAAAGQGAVVQQHRRRRRRVGVRAQLRASAPASSSSTRIPAASPSAGRQRRPTRKAFSTDPTSAFGGIIAFNRPRRCCSREAVARQFVEVVIAPDFDAAAREVFAAKQNVRLLSVALGRCAQRLRLQARRRRPAGAVSGPARAFARPTSGW